MANMMSHSTSLIGRIVCMKLYGKLHLHADANGELPSSDVVSRVTHRTEFSLSSFNDISADELGDVLDPVLGALVDDMNPPNGAFHVMEMPRGIVNTDQVSFRGIIVRVIPLYDVRTDDSKFQIAVSYH